jgi:hypothetical protein
MSGKYDHFGPKNKMVIFSTPASIPVMYIKTISLNKTARVGGIFRKNDSMRAKGSNV